MHRALAAGLALLLFALVPPAAASLRDDVNRLDEVSGEERSTLLRQLLATADPAVDALFAAYGRGALYLDRRDGSVVLGERKGARYQLQDPLTGEDLGLAGRRDVRRLRVDNALREELEMLLALRDLSSGDPGARRDATRAVVAAPGSGAVLALQARLEQEADESLRDELRTALAVLALASDDEAEIRRALPRLAGRTDPSLRGALAGFAERPDMPQDLRQEAQKLLARAEDKLRWLARVESVFFGLSLGSVLLLSAIGLAITFGVMGVINMAHGELIMLGAYTTWVLQQLLPGSPGLALILAIPAAFLVSGAVGLVIERGVIRFLYGRPLETLLATFGVSLILQQAVRSIFSPLNRSVVTPSWLSGAWEVIPGLSLTYNRLAILLFSLLVFAALLALMRYTRLGLQVRAVAQNRAMARALGVRSARVDALTFALGSGVAGVAGVALSQLTNVGPNLGQAYIIDSFLVVVFGGVGNLWGTLVAAFSLGIFNKLLEPATGAVLSKILVLLGLILFLQRRPQGLFPRQGRDGGTG